MWPDGALILFLLLAFYACLRANRVYRNRPRSLIHAERRVLPASAVLSTWSFEPPRLRRVLALSLLTLVAVGTGTLSVVLYYRPHVFFPLVVPIIVATYWIGNQIDILAKQYLLTSEGLWMRPQRTFLQAEQPHGPALLLVRWCEVDEIALDDRELRLRHAPWKLSTFEQLGRLLFGAVVTAVQLPDPPDEVVAAIRRLVEEGQRRGGEKEERSRCDPETSGPAERRPQVPPRGDRGESEPRSGGSLSRP
jgi:hypothetical protein